MQKLSAATTEEQIQEETEITQWWSMKTIRLGKSAVNINQKTARESKSSEAMEQDQSNGKGLSVAHNIKSNWSRKIEDGSIENLPMFKLELEETWQNSDGFCRRSTFGKNIPKENKTIMMIGATGAGKTTLINSMINYILGVQWKDDFRFVLIDDGKQKSQAERQTSAIAAYQINHMDGFQVPYSLTIVDTPGFGDAREISHDQKITAQIQEFFSAPGGIDRIDAVCFVVQASLAHLTQTQKNFFDSILSIFGKDIAENILVMVTFADGKKPPVLEAIKVSDVPCATNKSGEPLHFKFNNSAVFATNNQCAEDENSDCENFDQMFWNLGFSSMSKFFTSLNTMETKSLSLTQDVLKEGQQLEVNMQGLQHQINAGLTKLDEIKKTRAALEQHKAEMDANKDFEYELEVIVPKQIENNTDSYLTNSQNGYFTYAYANDSDKDKSWAMTDGKYTVCTGKCEWNVHFNQKYKWDYVPEKRKETYQVLKKRFEEAHGQAMSSEKIFEELEKEFQVVQDIVAELIEISQKSLEWLQEITLKPNPLSTPDYIDLMIESKKQEAKPGFQDHIQSLMVIRKKIEITGKTLTYKVLLSTNGVEIKDYYLTLESKNHSSHKILVKKPFFCAFMGFKIVLQKVSFDIYVEKDLGDIVQVKLEMDNSQWFCRHLRVKSPSGKCFEFPCYRWLDQTEVIIREGRAQLPQDDTDSLKKQRREELKSRQEIFRWIQCRQGFPQSIDAKLDELPLDVRFDQKKTSDFKWNFTLAFVNSSLNSFKGCFESWKDIADFMKIFGNYNLKKTLLGNVIQDWNTDYMFGYQFLNGCNPVMIRKCKELPDKFPVTHEMVEGCLQRGLTLQEELKAGNVYIADYEILEGVPANKTQPYSPYYLTAPICLLYNNRLNQIVPIAIQLSQHSGERSPIFLPSDDEHDWMLAKMWVKSSDFNIHQLVNHLLKTHLISEVFEMAMYRQLSAVHPVYKLLIPHVRFTIAINAEARERLVNEGGFFSKISSVSGPGIEEVMKRAMKTFTLKSLCFPESIKARGMEDAPKYYYRDDGMKIWEAINCFVSDVVKIYYDSDETVQKDVEIQKFVKDVSFGMNESDNFPKSLKTQVELAEYLTSVIFTASAQHAALNFGQFEWYGWIPNSPSTMRKPPPQQKGKVDIEYIMETLPDRYCSSEVLGTVWGLTQFQSDELFLGMYPDVHFTEKPMKEAIKNFRKKLDEVTNSIKLRNEGLAMDYCYLSPDKIPNSVAI